LKNGDSREVDHKDGNPNNNSKSNLRAVSRTTNREKGAKPMARAENRHTQHTRKPETRSREDRDLAEGMDKNKGPSVTNVLEQLGLAELLEQMRGPDLREPDARGPQEGADPEQDLDTDTDSDLGTDEENVLDIFNRRQRQRQDDERQRRREQRSPAPVPRTPMPMPPQEQMPPMPRRQPRPGPMPDQHPRQEQMPVPVPERKMPPKDPYRVYGPDEWPQEKDSGKFGVYGPGEAPVDPNSKFGVYGPGEAPTSDSDPFEVYGPDGKPQLKPGDPLYESIRAQVLKEYNGK
jgi:hypothetical protein